MWAMWPLSTPTPDHPLRQAAHLVVVESPCLEPSCSRLVLDAAN